MRFSRSIFLYAHLQLLNEIILLLRAFEVSVEQSVRQLKDSELINGLSNYPFKYLRKSKRNKNIITCKICLYTWLQIISSQQYRRPRNENQLHQNSLASFDVTDFRNRSRKTRAFFEIDFSLCTPATVQ